MDGGQIQPVTTTYKRGQVSAALWNVYVVHPRLGQLSEAPKSFARRIGKFIGLGIPFGDGERPGRAGTDFEFTFPHAIELGIALDLQDAGLNQLEIARWATFYREPIRAGITEVIANLETATFLMVRGRTFIEARNQFDEITPAVWQKLTIGKPAFVKRDTAHAALSELGVRDRTRIIVELTDLACALANALTRAPARRRGRQ